MTERGAAATKFKCAFVYTETEKLSDEIFLTSPYIKSIYKHNAENRTDPVGINFLVPVSFGSCVSNLKSVISEHMLRIKFMKTEIALRWMP